MHEPSAMGRWRSGHSENAGRQPVGASVRTQFSGQTQVAAQPSGSARAPSGQSGSGGGAQPVRPSKRDQPAGQDHGALQEPSGNAKAPSGQSSRRSGGAQPSPSGRRLQPSGHAHSGSCSAQSSQGGSGATVSDPPPQAARASRRSGLDQRNRDPFIVGHPNPRSAGSRTEGGRRAPSSMPAMSSRPCSETPWPAAAVFDNAVPVGTVARHEVAPHQRSTRSARSVFQRLGWPAFSISKCVSPACRF
jgi:hypothetical protein